MFIINKKFTDIERLSPGFGDNRCGDVELFDIKTRQNIRYTHGHLFLYAKYQDAVKDFPHETIIEIK